ncbi:TPA: hypothetical protein DCL30_02650 [Candidatus Peribacteria bacterium]|nr:MAG: hypothetical protein A3J91_05480 [Candidatus Peribacteria bacterium RIFOXYC2_FULL_58_10]OGJ84316.1 MAG: hypothetical protein A2529_03035 [Candidatus Peribacteria bacterium RIFOXYD2_FULL_58_15]HAI98421.1 hypothetical protein [Candidatus Peribacteria bacterium]HAS34007.1 hypothetical protein [Candidatus Peribacteria bacterium]
MYRSILAALLMGIVPLPATPPQSTSAPLAQVQIAPPVSRLSIAERLSASGVIVLDLQGGQQIYGKQTDVERPMASLTKLMTALLIVENHSLDVWVKIPSGADKVDGSKAYLPEGEQFTVGDLLSALLLPSANDAAYTLALYHSGSITAFVDAMNARAEALGLKGTHYANPSGIDSSQQWSTPQDVAWLAAFALRNPAIRSRMGKRGDRIVSREGTPIHFTHTHALMHAATPIEAGKTGTTEAAKQCLVSLVKTNGREYLVVLLHSLQRYTDMSIILDDLKKQPVL